MNTSTQKILNLSTKMARFKAKHFFTDTHLAFISQSFDEDTNEWVCRLVRQRIPARPQHRIPGCHRHRMGVEILLHETRHSNHLTAAKHMLTWMQTEVANR